MITFAEPMRSAWITFDLHGNICASLSPSTWNVHVRSPPLDTNGLAFVRAIEFPDANTFAPGDLLTVNIHLTKPAGWSVKLDPHTPVFRKPVAHIVNGETVFWRVSPARGFEHARGEVPYTVSTFNEVLVPTGSDMVQVTLRIKENFRFTGWELEPGVRTCEFHTWLHDPRNDNEPYRIDAAFEVRRRRKPW